MSVKHAQDVEALLVKSGEKTSFQVLISSQEGSNFTLRRFVMQPGGSIPEHTNTVEHEQYVLKGHTNIGIDGEAFEVHAGDVIFTQEGSPHWYQNMGQDNFEFQCIIPNKPDEIKLITEEC
jgi:quercetin dioxygenase-like cupin family protein